MNLTRSPEDVAAELSAATEAAAIQAQHPTITTFVLVAIQNGQPVRMITQCKPGQRTKWLDLLGIGMAEDIDAIWGVAWRDNRGVVRSAGTNQTYVAEAKQIISDIHVRDDGFGASCEDFTDEAAQVHTRLMADTVDEGLMWDHFPLTPGERSGALELYGLVMSNDIDDPHWGMAWSLLWTDRRTGNKKPITMVLGNDVAMGVRVLRNHGGDPA